MTNPKFNYKNKSDITFNVNHIGKAFKTESRASYFDKKYRENLDYDSYTDKIAKVAKYYMGKQAAEKQYKPM